MKDVPILYEDDELIVVNKPAGLPVQGGEGIAVCLLDVLERQTGAKVYPVHRLDRDTAGVLAVARTSAAAAALSKLITSGALVKEYLAITVGAPPDRGGVIRSPAGKPGAEKAADTAYRVLSVASGLALLSLTLGTGRTHQIRIHLASIGCPIVADDKHGDFRANRELRRTLGARKLQLLSSSLEFPVAGKRERFTAPLPAHMADLVERAGLQLPPGHRADS